MSFLDTTFERRIAEVAYFSAEAKLLWRRLLPRHLDCDPLVAIRAGNLPV